MPDIFGLPTLVDIADVISEGNVYKALVKLILCAIFFGYIMITVTIWIVYSDEKTLIDVVYGQYETVLSLIISLKNKILGLKII